MSLSNAYVLAFVALLAVANPARAQEFIGQYIAFIGPQDFFNSSGTGIGSVCGVLQQDRANFHSFGKRDPQDQSDPFFANRTAQSVIGRDCRAAQSDAAQSEIIDSIKAGKPISVPVTIIGRGNRPEFIIFGFIAG